MGVPSSTGTLWSPSNFRRQWRDFRSAVEHGYPDWVTPKTFRKTVATLLRDEVSLEAAGGQLGHSGTKVTKEHYARRVFEAPDQTAVLQWFGNEEAPRASGKPGAPVGRPTRR